RTRTPANDPSVRRKNTIRSLEETERGEIGMSVGATVNKHIQELGGGFMFSREARTYAAETGIDEFFGPYTRGRGGVLGEVDADVVTAAFGFFPGHSIRTA